MTISGRRPTVESKPENEEGDGRFVKDSLLIFG